MFKFHIFATVTLAVVAVLVRCIDRNDITSWLTKSVCFNESTGDILLIDPFDDCIPMRKYKVGDPLVYSNIDQFGYQISDSYSLLDKSGQHLIFHSFDYEPFNVFNQHSGSDGYDVYSVGSDVVSRTNTKDGGGYGSTFLDLLVPLGMHGYYFPLKDTQNQDKTSILFLGYIGRKMAKSSRVNVPRAIALTLSLAGNY